MNLIFPLLTAASLVYSFTLGTAGNTLASGLDAAAKSIQVILSLAGMLCFWSGILEIIARGGISAKLEKILFPITHLLFPKLKKGSAPLRLIGENIAANLLGMGNAATPAGIAAMEELDKINPHPAYPSDEMCIFTVLNTSSLQLIPATVISLRASCGASDAGDILFAVWICSAASLTASLLCIKLTTSLCRIFRTRRIRQHTAFRTYSPKKQ